MLNKEWTIDVLYADVMNLHPENNIDKWLSKLTFTNTV